MELKLLLWAAVEFEDPLALKEVPLLLVDVLKEVPLLLFDVLLDVDISAIFFEEFLLDEGPNLD